MSDVGMTSDACIKEADDMFSHLLEAMMHYLHRDERGAYFVDPVYGIVRNRVNAEVCKALIRVGKTEHVPEILQYVCSCQADDGSWNEIHPNYNQPSALITSFIGEALVLAYSQVALPKKQHLALEKSIQKAYLYVRAAEISPGYYLKSEKYSADCLNVNASCGCFLAKYGEMFQDSDALAAAKAAALHTIAFQDADGAYPYTTPEKGTYAFAFDVPCVHYQGVTLYYLAKINSVVHDADVDASISRAAAWLVSVQKADGSFCWGDSGLMFAYYLSGAAAFAYASFLCAAKNDEKYVLNAELALRQLQKNMVRTGTNAGIMLRWEPAGKLSIAGDAGVSWKSASLGVYPMKQRLFRFGYFLYRQVARRRYAETVDPTFFNRLCSLMGIQASTVEPFNNFPDMFMTSEVLDCLSYIRKLE